MLLAIDPALTCSGWAVFAQRSLLSCGVVVTKTTQDLSDRLTAIPKAGIINVAEVSEFVAEWPEVYRGSKVNANNLLYLPAVIGVCLGHFSPVIVRLPMPKQWKGQVPKDIHGARILRALSAAETGIAVASKVRESLRHNMIDAIGLGLWYLNRKV